MSSPNIGQKELINDRKNENIKEKTITKLQETSQNTIYNILDLNGTHSETKKNTDK